MAIDFSDAFALLRSTLAQWGLQSLEQDVRGYLETGDSVDVAIMKLRETDTYKKRFKANQDRIAKGIAPLSEAEYISTENTYRQLMRSYGLPEGFYDSQDDFQKFLSNDVSPQELRDKVVLATEKYINAPSDVRDQFIRFGLNPSEAIATILDPTVAEPLIRQRLTAVGLAAEAARAFGERERLTQERALELARQGLSEDEARKGFGDLAGRQDNDLALARRQGADVSTEDLENEALFGRRNAGLDRARNQEQADFRGNYVGTETGFERSARGLY